MDVRRHVGMTGGIDTDLDLRVRSSTAVSTTEPATPELLRVVSGIVLVCAAAAWPQPASETASATMATIEPMERRSIMGSHCAEGGLTAGTNGGRDAGTDRSATKEPTATRTGRRRPRRLQELDRAVSRARPPNPTRPMRGDGIAFERSREEEALAEVAPRLLQLAAAASPLDPLGDRLELAASAPSARSSARARIRCRDASSVATNDRSILRMSTGNRRR